METLFTYALLALTSVLIGQIIYFALQTAHNRDLTKRLNSLMDQALIASEGLISALNANEEATKISTQYQIGPDTVHLVSTGKKKKARTKRLSN